MLDYIVHARNYGQSNVTLKGVRQILPPLFEYIDGSYGGPLNVVFTKTWVTDHWELDWNFNSPLPKVFSESSFQVPFQVGGTLASGAYAEFGTGEVYYSAFGEQEVLQAGSLLDKIAIGLYDITVEADGYTVEANAGIYQSGTGLNSYRGQ